MSNLKSYLNKAARVVVTNSPLILTVVSVAGVATTAIFAVKATPTAEKVLREEMNRLCKDPDVEDAELSVKDIVRLTWRLYIPALIVGGTTVLCIVGAHTMSRKQHAALASAYSIAEVAAKEYQAKVLDVIGEREEGKILDAIAGDKVDRNPPVENNIIITGNGETLCYEPLSGRYFKSDIEKIRRVENTINKKLLEDDWVSLNQLYYELGLESTKLGDEMGWLSDKLIEFRFVSHLTGDGVPCLVLDHENEPRYGALVGY